MGGVERKPTEREVEQRVGWNPASNSEGEEGFAVREVQGRRAPLNCSEHFRGFFGAHSNANRSIDCRIRAELETGFRSPRNELADSAGSRQYGLLLRPPWVPPRPRYLRRQRAGKSFLLLLVFLLVTVSNFTSSFEYNWFSSYPFPPIPHENLPQLDPYGCHL